MSRATRRQQLNYDNENRTVVTVCFKPCVRVLQQVSRTTIPITWRYRSRVATPTQDRNVRINERRMDQHKRVDGLTAPSSSAELIRYNAMRSVAHRYYAQASFNIGPVRSLVDETKNTASILSLAQRTVFVVKGTK